MNSQERVDLLATIAELCQRYPDWRVGQLVANVAGWADQEIWDVKDEQLLEAALALAAADAVADGFRRPDQELYLIAFGTVTRESPDQTRQERVVASLVPRRKGASWRPFGRALILVITSAIRGSHFARSS